MAKVLRTLARGANALNNSLYRASGGRLLGKLRGMRVLLLSAAAENWTVTALEK
jgi:hypothetical protein